MPKLKIFNRRALSCTSTRTHLEGRRSVVLMNLFFKPVRASRVKGFQGPYGDSQLVLTLYRIYFFCFQMRNCLPESMKNGDAEIFPVYYSLNFQIESVQKICRQNLPKIKLCDWPNKLDTTSWQVLNTTESVGWRDSNYFFGI